LVGFPLVVLSTTMRQPETELGFTQASIVSAAVRSRLFASAALA
jgi:hypothetical protein